jgi:hypothetical protein
MFPKFLRTVISFLVCLFVASCASEVHRIPTGLIPTTTGTDRVIVLAANTEVAPANGYKRVLRYGSKWKFIGHISQGSVFEIQNDVFMLEAKHMHQAHLVLSSNNRLVGFFLPVEEAFVPLSASVQLSVKDK